VPAKLLEQIGLGSDGRSDVIAWAGAGRAARASVLAYTEQNDGATVALGELTGDDPNHAAMPRRVFDHQGGPIEKRRIAGNPFLGGRQDLLGQQTAAAVEPLQLGGK